MISYEREVKGIAGDNSRADFFLAHADSSKSSSSSSSSSIRLRGTSEAPAQTLPRRTVLEVKTVVDTDVAASTVPAAEDDAQPEKKEKKAKKSAASSKKKECVFVSHDVPYVRHAIFPWGRAAQTVDDEGGKVVSARAIKHVDELAALARGDRRAGHTSRRSGGVSGSVAPGPKDSGASGVGSEEGERLGACVLFVVTRGDAVAFRANHEACPVFARRLLAAHEDGVCVLAHRVTWGEGEDEGKAFYSGELPVSFTPT